MSSHPNSRAGVNNVTRTLEPAPSEQNTGPHPHPGTPRNAGRRFPSGSVGTTARQRLAEVIGRFDAGISVPVLILALLVLAAAVPQLLAPHGPLEVRPAEAFSGPSAAHWFGTDESGRDVYSRVIHGAGSSLLIGVLATIIGLGVALVLGSIAGLGTKAVDFGVSRFLEVLFAFPGLLLALLVITILGPGIITTTIAVGLSTAPGYARQIGRASCRERVF